MAAARLQHQAARPSMFERVPGKPTRPHGGKASWRLIQRRSHRRIWHPAAGSSVATAGGTGAASMARRGRRCQRRRHERFRTGDSDDDGGGGTGNRGRHGVAAAMAGERAVAGRCGACGWPVAGSVKETWPDDVQCKEECRKKTWREEAWTEAVVRGDAVEACVGAARRGRPAWQCWPDR